jgi:hypothetical protein
VVRPRLFATSSVEHPNEVGSAIERRVSCARDESVDQSIVVASTRLFVAAAAGGGEGDRRVEGEDDRLFAVAGVAEALAVPVGDAEREDAGGVGGKVGVFVLLRVVSARELPAHADQVRNEVVAVVSPEACAPLAEAVVDDFPDERFGVFDPARAFPELQLRSENTHLWPPFE